MFPYLRTFLAGGACLSGSVMELTSWSSNPQLLREGSWWIATSASLSLVEKNPDPFSTQSFSRSLEGTYSSCSWWQNIRSPLHWLSLLGKTSPGWFHCSLFWVSWHHSKVSCMDPNSCLRLSFRGTHSSVQNSNQCCPPPLGYKVLSEQILCSSASSWVVSSSLRNFLSFLWMKTPFIF